MEESFLREQAARCRTLAAEADKFTKKRLLALAERYEKMLRNKIDRASGSRSGD